MDPRTEDVLRKISRVRADREQTEAAKLEVAKKLKAAQSELQKLCAEKAALKETVVKKQETVRTMKQQCDAHLQKERRQREQTEETRKRMEDLTSKIREESLQQRKQRMAFQEQMEEFMNAHKALAQRYDAKRLGAETDQMKERRKGLVQEEKETLAKLQGLEETEAKLQEEGVLTSAALFLRSEEAACAAKLFQEENRNAKDLLEELAERQMAVRNTYHRLKSSLEDAEKQQLEVSQAPLEKSQRATISMTIPFPCVQ